ncbi:MAG: isoprenylcysteine carboxylmethyltransferase family protein [Candidatus Omnitrophica bacterium]|nr:isoprenylcysteine carboxylmethyltransferase family protein [Candidatus Omnitrophota bacterium]
MKQRIKVDSGLLLLMVILTGFWYFYPQLYTGNVFWDGILSFIGMLLIFKGAFLRMAARSHKKAHSGQGVALVITGPYAYMRNPMYLGTCLIGCGFILIAWPWWALPIFVGLFYLRFKIQIVKEETHLEEMFGDTYRSYCDRVPRIWPYMKNWLKIKIRDVMNLDEAFLIKEKWLLLLCPAAVVVLKSVKELFVYHQTDIMQTLLIVGLAALLEAAALIIFYSDR